MSRRIVITAGASGLGLAMAEAFLEAGDRVAVCDADADAVASVTKAHPGMRAEVADVTDPAALGTFFAQVEADWGGADVVCSNAGVGGPAGHIEDIGYEDWKHCLAVNLDGAFLTCRWAAHVMRAQGSGLILLTSSISGLFGFPQRTPYVAAKWGIVGLTKALASELGPAGVRVNAICPGAVEGPRMDRVISMEAAARGVSEEDVRRGFTDGVALRRFVRKDEVAAMALFLASDGAAAITGQALVVDGHTERVT
ncbi:SDR family oxidoreductase [Roseibacterium sp. SDUM158016]|uniref:SDR family oxidoreductase n=1 Tax=Roseicyclus sediminis TaxID=2980997 RepID=UPI0021D0D0B2|nr:SDR family oxidoreductase [Roseibacterium sp. SDUM158016]MCU4651783.1 SDR family oxidoreductase [Roseibacterium sp. SDUM158016]